jgi:hypothetical protein
MQLTVEMSRTGVDKRAGNEQEISQLGHHHMSGKPAGFFTSFLVISTHGESAEYKHIPCTIQHGVTPNPSCLALTIDHRETLP